jgi:hypothetical protein
MATACRHAMLQRDAFHELHGDKHLAVLLANLVDRADVGMIQRRGCARLSPKTFHCLWDLGQILRKKLKRDKPAKGRVFGLVDNTHPAAAQLFNDAVARDGLADHWKTPAFGWLQS